MEITQGKLILLSGKRHENSFCAVVISFCPCHYKVIWGASALTIRKDVLVCLTRTRSLMIPYALWHSCLMPCMSFKSARLFLQLPSGVWNSTPKLFESFYCIWREIIPFLQNHSQSNAFASLKRSPHVKHKCLSPCHMQQMKRENNGSVKDWKWRGHPLCWF